MKKMILVALAVFAIGTAQAKTVKTTFPVSGKCGMCEKRIEKAAKAVPGVIAANYSLDKQELSLVYDNKKTDPKKVQQAIAAVGHDAGDVKATDEAYNALHGCCKYRK